MKRYNQNEIDELVQILKQDGVISVPTDTVYGLCASIKSKKAYDKLIKIKNRPKNKLLPIMCADLEQIKDIAKVNKNTEKIIRKLMPGPITLVLEKKNKLPYFVNSGEFTIAVRMATSEALYKLIKKLDSPIFLSSANISGQPACESLDEIEEKCPDLDGMMVGNIVFGKGSTIVDCTSNNVKIIREGPISMEKIKESIAKNTVEKINLQNVNIAE